MTSADEDVATRTMAHHFFLLLLLPLAFPSRLLFCLATAIFVATAVLITIGSLGSAFSCGTSFMTVYGHIACWRFVLGAGVGGELAVPSYPPLLPPSFPPS